MRLIDADAFEKFIKKKYKDGESTDDIKDQMLFDLSYQPTAYDVEKVVAELESEVERWRESGEECNDKHDIAVSEGFKRAVQIVKRGGVE